MNKIRIEIKLSLSKTGVDLLNARYLLLEASPVIDCEALIILTLLSRILFLFRMTETSIVGENLTNQKCRHHR